MASVIAEPLERIAAVPAIGVARPSVADALRYGREHDWIGHHIATALAMIYLFLLPLATAPKDWAFAFLAMWTIVRLPHTFRSYSVFPRLALFWAALAWVLWNLLSFTWSGDLAQAWDEFKVQRMLATPFLLWPILDRAPWLVMAALAGVLAQNGVQVLQEIGWLPMQVTGEGRLRGLIHPIHSGMWFGAAMIWHLSAALNTRGWRRWLCVALIVVSGVGLVATGSRGPWIAASVALLAASLVMPFRRGRADRAAQVLCVAGAMSLLLIWLLLVVVAHLDSHRKPGESMISPRISHAWQEVVNARRDQVYWTSTGLRLGLWNWAMEVWRSSPLVGTGAGGFPAAYQRLDSFHRACDNAIERSMIQEVPGYTQAERAGEDVTKLRTYRRGLRLGENRIDYLTRDHAHSTYLHTLASEGAVGLALLVVVLIVLARHAWRDPPDHPFVDGSLFVLLSWIVGAQFDCYELNGHQLGLLGFIAAITLPGRAPVRWQRSAIDEQVNR